MKNKTAEKLLKKVRADYDVISEDFDVTRQYKWKEFDKFLKYIKDEDRIADIGCGNGRFLKYIRDVRNIQYIGVDNSKELIKIAKEEFPGEEFKLGDLLKIPIEDNSQDVVVSIAALHHIPSVELRKQAVEEMHRILKKDGILIITVWNLFQPKYMKYIWKARIKSLLTLGKYGPRDLFIPWGRTSVKRYYYAFKENELKDLLEKKFEIIDKFKDNNFLVICKK